MTIYLDLIFLLNFAFDFLLLLAVKIILKRNIKLYRIILGALVGAISIFLLFLKINSLELFAFKIIISYAMILVAFGYKNIKYFGSNFLFLYIVSIVLGGFMYMLNLQFSYKNQGLIFFHNGMSINIVFLLIFSPIIIYIYIRQARSLREDFNNYYQVTAVFSNNNKVYLTGFLDSGNKLRDPYNKKPIILVEKKKLEGIISLKKPILVPYNSLNHKSILKCFKVDKLFIEGKETKNALIGLFEDKINMDGIDCILNASLMEDI